MEVIVNSSLISRLQYNPEAEEMEVTFLRDGKTWRYSGVTPEVFQAFSTAESVGKFYNANIKGKYQGVEA